MTVPNNDLIDEFVEIMMKHTDAPKAFIEAGAYALISSLIGQYCNSTWVFGGRPNLFIVMSSIPGRTRRSTVQNAVDFLFKKCWFEINLKSLPAEEMTETEEGQPTEEPEEKPKKKRKSNRVIAKEITNDMLIEEGSPEGICDHLEETGLKVYHISNEEFGGTLSRMFGKHYEAGVHTMFIKLYNGKGCKICLSSRGKGKKNRRVPDGLYVTMFCGMQEMGEYIDESAIKQGLTRRILIVYIPQSDRYLPYIRENCYALWEELEDYANKLLALVEIYRQAQEDNIKYEINHSVREGRENPYVDIQWNPDVEKAINDYDKSVVAELDQAKNLKNISKQSYAEHLFKLAMCREMSKPNSLKQTDDGYWLVKVSKNSFDKAKAFLDNIGGNVDSIYDNIGTRKFEPRNTEISVDVVVGIILKEPNGIERTELLTKLRWDAEDLDRILEQAVKEGKIHAEKVNTGKPGRPPFVWKYGPDTREEGTME